MLCSQRYEQPVPQMGLNTDSQLKCGPVDHNLHTISKGMLDQNDPGTLGADVMGVLGPSPSSEGIDSMAAAVLSVVTIVVP